MADASSGSFTYSYLPFSNLLSTISSSAHDVTNTYESTRNVLASKQNKAGTTVISQYDYTVNAIGQRTNLTTSGTAFPAMPTWLWGYDTLGQVTTADSNVNTSDRAYQYDAIGNRLFAENGAAQIPTTLGLNTTGYTPDALNQYNAITAYNASGVAETPVVPVFDDDGNMTQGPLPVSPSTNCTLVWDAENRLIEVKSASNVTLVKYAYDALSRRVSRSVSASPNSYTLYLYDGWNCIAEWNANPQSVTLTSTRTWGLDLSSTPQGAGGVGGLLSEKQVNNTFYPTYDGNGNISEYLAADGSTAAHYEYDPFGNIVKESYTSGYNASSFNYKFSTKPLDQATGLYYYGYRYYDPKTGRWPSRDPIGERGGKNLYGFVGNNAVNRWDVLGLRWEIGSWERTQAVREKVKSQIDVLAQEIINEGKNAGVPLGCKTTAQNTQVLVQFKKKSDVAFANMYLTGFFALGGVSVNLVGSGEYSYDCCKRKPVAYHVDIDASFRDDFDELINIWEPGWGDTGITFVGSWTEEYKGSY